MMQFSKILWRVVICCMLWIIGPFNVLAQLEVKIQKDPEKDTLLIGEDIILEALTKDQDPRVGCKWTHEGPGTLEGSDNCSLFYVAPDSLGELSAQVTIMVVVTWPDLQTASESVHLTILTPEPPPSPTPTPTPTPSPTPTPIPTAIPTPTPVPTVPPQLRQVFLSYNDTSYYLYPGETVTMFVDMSGNLGENIFIDCIATRGKAFCDGQTLTYTVPDRAGTRDMVTIKVRDSETNDIIDGTTVKVKIIEPQ